LGPYSYRFYVFNGSTWSVGRDWSPVDQWTWIPPSTGVYSLQVWVRNAGSGANWDAWAGSDSLTVTPPTTLPVTSLMVAPMAPLFAPAPAALSTITTGGTGPYSYQFWVFNGSGWTIAQPWSPLSTFTWRPPTTGTYWLQVWVRNLGSSAAW